MTFYIDTGLEPQSKIIARVHCLETFKNGGFYVQFEKIIRNLRKHQLNLIPANRLNLFASVVNNRVISEAIAQFEAETLILRNAPFTDIGEGHRMLQFAYSHIIQGKKTFFAEIHRNGLGLTVAEYVFISKTFEIETPFSNTFLLITLFHEAAHLYKRISPLGLLHNFSPSFTSILREGTHEEQVEDGIRFERILLPGFTDTIYSRTTIMLLDISSWNQSLAEFTKQFQALQRDAERRDELGYRQKKSKEVVKCPGPGGGIHLR